MINYVLLFFLVGVGTLCATPQDAPNHPEIMVENRSYHVRVLLSEFSLLENTIAITTPSGFLLCDSAYENSGTLRSTQQCLTVTFKDGFFYLNGKRLLKQTCVIKPIDGLLKFQNNAYQGCFVLTTDGVNAYLINSLDIEEYVLSVMSSEGWPGWPLEMNKVLAITCRSYAIAMVKQAYTAKRPYHVTNTNAHQVYGGARVNKDLQRAIDETRGLFLSYDNKPILAMFDICCGGVIPAGIHGFDFSKAPYLARTYACTHCKTCSSYHWQLSVSKDELLETLKKEFPELTKFRDVKITKKDKAGLVVHVTLKGVRAPVTLTGRKLYSLYKGIRSYCFNVSKKGNTITFKGRGFGHHIGLCQWGARAMVRDGWHYKRILSFYYPETMLMRLT